MYWWMLDTNNTNISITVLTCLTRASRYTGLEDIGTPLDVNRVPDAVTDRLGAVEVQLDWLNTMKKD